MKDISEPISADLSDPARTLRADPKTLKLHVAENRDLKRSYGWTTVEITLVEVEQRLLTHTELENKDQSEVFVPGAIQGDRRKKPAVSELSALVIDLDKGEDLDELRALIRAKDLYATIYSTHSHLSRETEIKLDDYRKFMSGNEVTAEGLKRFLLEVRKFRPWVVKEVEVADCYRDTPDGAVCVARHAALPKFRVVFPLRNPFRRRDYMPKGMTQVEFEALWKVKYGAVADSLGVEWDPSCTDVSRCFFYPSCRPGAERIAEKIDGLLLDLEVVEVEPPTDETCARKIMAPDGGPGSANHYTFQGFNLKAWAAQYGSTFEIETALRASKRLPAGFFRAERDAGGVHIDCPFEHDHSESGGTGTFVVNASENGEHGFSIFCSHSSCKTRRGNGTSIDRLIFVKKMLDDGWLTLDDLQNPELGGGPISARVYHESRRQAQRCDLRVVDREGRGIDAGIFHASMIAKPGLFDFDRLNELCGTQIASDVTAEQMAEFIESGRVTVAHLIECTKHDAPPETDDAYTAKLKALAREKSAGKVLGRQTDAQLAAIAKEFEVKQKTIEHDFKRFEERTRPSGISPEFGVLSAEDTALVKPMRDYVRDFAILNTGGKGVVMSLRQPDLSKALMPRDDFEFLHRNDWFEVVGEDGSITTIYPAKRFLAKPPKNAQVYRGGLVFKPAGTVAADQYNLYRGMLLEPDESGSWSLLRDLLHEVWAQGDDDITAWLVEYLMHIIAYPGEKVETSIAIRGGYGDGKSVVFVLLRAILGDMLLRVSNHRMILGNFNEALIGKLVTVLEEAAFAGDKAAFDKMKELITGKDVLINPKFKAPITVDNYSRLIVISNHDHFLHIKPEDRRYTVLESSPAWRGTNRFEQLVDQWANGGAARFVYDALNHSFRHFDDRRGLIINANLKTKAAIRQMAQSRSALEKCIVGFLLRGKFQSHKSADYHVFVDGVATQKLWELDEPLQIESLVLEQAMTSWLRDFDPTAARHEATLHTIIGTLTTYAGEIGEARPKGPREIATGRRPQLPTVRTLPPRRQAVQHAWENGLITDEEYAAAIPAPAPVELGTWAALFLEGECESDDPAPEVRTELDTWEVLFLEGECKADDPPLEARYRMAFPESVEEQFARRRQLWLPLFLHDEGGDVSVENRLPI